MCSQRSTALPSPQACPCGKCSTTKDAALCWLRFGLSVIPGVPGSKKTALTWDEWLENLSAKSIEYHWASNPSHELGVILGDDYIVFDADTPESLAALHQIEKAYDVTSDLIVKTKHGKHHYYKRAIGTFAKSDGHNSEKYPKRIDVKTGRAFVILPPSTDKTVQLCDVEQADELAEAGQDFIDAIFRHNSRPEPRKPTPKPKAEPLPADLAKLRPLVNLIDPDSGYDDWFSIAAAIHTETQGSDGGFEIFDDWSSHGDKYPGAEKLRYTWEHLQSVDNPKTFATIVYIARNQGADVNPIIGSGELFEACEMESIDPAESKQPEEPPYTAKSVELALIQKQFALINLDGKIFLLNKYSVNEVTEQGLAKKLELSNLSDGKLLLQRTIAANFPKANDRGIIAEFLISPETDCFEGVEFNPTSTTNGLLNLWVGPTIVPKKGLWTLIEAFLREIICDGDNAAYNYLLSYIAHALQQPEDKPGVMIILLGGQGVGKGTLGRIIQKIWSVTFVQLNNIDNITGNFNAVLERSYFIFLDEALFAGNRRASDALKSLVTEPFVQINEKFQPSRQIRSYHRFVAATNADHFKNTERDDRRDFTLRVSEDKKGDFGYWTALNQEIGNGGAEALAHDLMAMDLTDFNVRDKPNTGELVKQKILSLDPFANWWFEVLQNGCINGENDWPVFIKTTTIIEGIRDLSSGRLYRMPTTQSVAKDIEKVCPGARKMQRQDQFERARGYALPPLQEAREVFEGYIGGPIQWDDIDPEDPTA